MSVRIDLSHLTRLITQTIFSLSEIFLQFKGSVFIAILDCFLEPIFCFYAIAFLILRKSKVELCACIT